MRGGVAAEGSELDDGLHLSLEEDRKDDDVAWKGLEETRADAGGVGWQVGDQHPALLDRALPDEALAEVEQPGVSGLAVVRFADNYCAFAASQAEAHEAFAVITAALNAEGMRPHPVKSRVRPTARAGG